MSNSTKYFLIGFGLVVLTIIVDKVIKWEHWLIPTAYFLSIIFLIMGIVNKRKYY